MPTGQTRRAWAARAAKPPNNERNLRNDLRQARDRPRARPVRDVSKAFLSILGDLNAPALGEGRVCPVGIRTYLDYLCFSGHRTPNIERNLRRPSKRRPQALVLAKIQGHPCFARSADKPSLQAGVFDAPPQLVDAKAGLGRREDHLFGIHPELLGKAGFLLGGLVAAELIGLGERDHEGQLLVA